MLQGNAEPSVVLFVEQSKAVQLQSFRGNQTVVQADKPFILDVEDLMVHKFILGKRVLVLESFKEVLKELFPSTLFAREHQGLSLRGLQHDVVFCFYEGF